MKTRSCNLPYAKECMSITLICVFSAIYAFLSFSTIASESKKFSIKASPTYGDCGAPRILDAVLPGETLYFTVKCSGVSIKPSGQCSFVVSYELADEGSRIVDSGKIGELKQRIVFRKTLDGETTRFDIRFAIGKSLSAGRYSFKITVVHSETGSQAEELIGLSVIDSGQFAIGNYELAIDMKNGKLQRGGCFSVGEWGVLHFFAQGLKSEANKVRMKVVLTVTDEDDNPVGDASVVSKVETDKNFSGVYALFAGVYLTEPGNFIFCLEVQDVITGDVVAEKIPIKVVDNWP